MVAPAQPVAPTRAPTRERPYEDFPLDMGCIARISPPPALSRKIRQLKISSFDVRSSPALALPGVPCIVRALITLPAPGH